MRICFVCDEYPPGPCGGIGTVTRTLARGLTDRGHEVRSVGTYSRQYPAPDRQDDAGVQVTRLRSSKRPGRWLVDRWRLYRQLRVWARRGEIDLVEIPDWAGWAAGWPRLSVPVVARLHGSIGFFQAEMGQPLNRMAYRLERASLRRVDAISSVSQYAGRRTRELYRLARRIDAILPNPITIPNDAPAPEPRSRWDVVFTGTLVEKKGVIALIRSWPTVLAQCPEARLHLYGKDGKAPAGGSMQEHLLSLLTDAQRATIVFHGHVEHATLNAALRQARLAVFPSFAETFGAAPFEAMAVGCPTIYSTAGPGPELINADVEALLVDPSDPADIAQAITRLLTDDDLAQRLADAGRQAVHDRYSLDVLLPQNEAYFQQCIDEFHPSLKRQQRRMTGAIADASGSDPDEETVPS